MRVTWYGHAAFRLEPERDGPSIVTDPYDPETSGYRPIPEPADIVVRSSSNDDWHNNARLVPGEPALVEALDLARTGRAREVGGVRFSAVEAFESEDAARGRDADACAIYRFALDGIHVAHLGDVGLALSSEQLAFLDGTDVLLALAGGHPTIALPDLMTAIEAVRPKLVIPMHFRTLRVTMANMLWISELIGLFGEERTDFAHGERASITRDDLPDATRMLVLDHL